MPTHSRPLELDEHVVLACGTREAEAFFSGAAAVAAWFGARRGQEGTVLPTRPRPLEFRRRNEEWLLVPHGLVVDGTIAGLRCSAYLTVQAVAAPRPGMPLAAVTEVRVHVELEGRAGAGRCASSIRDVICRGLEHIRLELDVDSGLVEPD
jgi:hypothetical protein